MDVVIVGAGIVGLATAYQLLLAKPGLKIAILEKEASPASHQTGRNSGVVHSGIYYKPGSLKAKNCIAGKKELLAFCERFGIETQQVGKVIIATNENEIPLLDEIAERGKANGVSLQKVDPFQLKEIEPYAQGKKALWIPECAILSYPAVARALVKEIGRLGGAVHFSQSVQKIETQQKKIKIETKNREFEASVLINCAGLFSDRLAQKALGKDAGLGQIIPFRGEYYELSAEKRHLIKGLIYPVKDPRFPFLGVHLTRMIDGGVEAGPNAVLALAREGYKKSDINFKDCLEMVSFAGFWKMAAQHWTTGIYEILRSCSKKLFLRDLQKLVPNLEEKDLAAGNRGIRAQAVANNGKLIDDFAIVEEKKMIHVLNAPSPAATASFSIGRHIAKKAVEQLEWM